MNQFSRSEPRPSTSSSQKHFNFEEDISPTKDEIDLYICDKDTPISMLDRHPAIKMVFLRYNSALPSSAPVERLFSAASLVLTTRRNKLSDKLLEYLLLLKIHKKLWNFSKIKGNAFNGPIWIYDFDFDLNHDLNLILDDLIYDLNFDLNRVLKNDLIWFMI